MFFVGRTMATSKKRKIGTNDHNSTCLPAGSVNPVIDRTAVKQRLSPGDAQLQDMVAERGVQQPLQGLAGTLEKVTPTVARVPGFQFRQNIAKLASHLR